MNKNYDEFIKILEEELIAAAGCTEPIALALAGAKCTEILKDFPEKIKINVSGNMIKNVQGVIIPGTEDLFGIEYSVILGAIVADSSKNLEVLNGMKKEQIDEAVKVKEKNICTIEKEDTEIKLYIKVEMFKGDNSALVEIAHTHSNIIRLERNGKQLFYNPCEADDFNSSLTDRSKLSVKSIIDFANTLNIDDIKDLLNKQLEYNFKIAEEGLTNKYGLSAGKIILDNSNGVLKEKMKAYASSASDARMGGCDLPVIINSGSGNQGLTIANSLNVYFKENNISDDKKYRALALANLIAIHTKSKIGRLSAFCGAVSASIGVGSAITYLENGTNENIEGTIKNCVGNLTGVICDGAKCSCAIKIASSVEASYLSHQLSMQNNVIGDGIGIVHKSVEQTIDNLAIIASKSMMETDEMILNIMTQ